MRFRRRAFIIVLLLLLTFVAAGYLSIVFVDKQIKKQNIELISWQLPELNNRFFQIEKLEFRYQNDYRVTIQGLRADSADGFIKALSDYQENTTLSSTQQNIDRLSIEHLQIQLPPKTPETLSTDTTFKINDLTGSLKNNLKTLPQSSTLIFLPKALEIKHLTVITPCPAGECELKAKLNLQTHSETKPQPEKIRLQLVLNVQDTAMPTVELHNRLDLILPMDNLSNFEFSMQNLLKTTRPSRNGQNPIQLAVNTHKLQEQGKDLLRIIGRLSGELPEIQTVSDSPPKLMNSWIDFVNLYNRWNPEPMVAEELAARITPFLQADSDETIKTASKDNFELALDSTLDLGRLAAIESNENLLEQIDLNTEFVLTLNQPVSIPDAAWVNGRLHGKINLKNGQIDDYSVTVNGTADHLGKLAKPLWLNKQGWKFEAVQFKLLSVQQNPELSLKQLPFKLTINSVQDLPENLKETATASAIKQGEKIELQSAGTVWLSQAPAVEIHHAQIGLQNSRLSLNPKQHFKNFKADIQLSGQVTPENSKIDLQQANLSGTLKNNEQTLKIRNLQMQDFLLTIADLKQAIQTLDIQGKKLKLNADFRSPELSLEPSNVTLQKIRLKPDQNRDFKTFTADYKGQLKNLEHPQLHPQIWTENGTVTAKFAMLPTSLESLKNLQINGEMANTAGIRIEHLIHYRPELLKVRWKLADHYFLAGNSFKETFVSWPELLSFSTGKLSAKGQLQLDPQKLLSAADLADTLQNSLKAQSEFQLSVIDGIYNETAFKQLNLNSRLILEKGHLQTTIEKMDLEEVNHGVITGPVKIKAAMQTPLKNWSATELDLQKAEVQIFDGKARLAPKVVRLDQPIYAELFLDKIDLQALLLQYPSVEIYGTGHLQGQLPFTLDLSEGFKQKPVFFISDGHLYASESGGVLQYQTDSSSLKQMHKSMELALNLLEDFHYQVLDSRISLDENQKLLLNLRLQGNNPKVERGRQVNFNIQIEQDLPALITSMQISNQINETIQKRIQEKLNNRLLKQKK